MAKIETIYQGYKCCACHHELELSMDKSENSCFKRNIECPNCSCFMTIQEDKWRIQVEFDDPHDLFGGYIFDDREPFR